MRGRGSDPSALCHASAGSKDCAILQPAVVFLHAFLTCRFHQIFERTIAMPDPVVTLSAAPTNKVIAATGGSAFGAAIATLVLALIRSMGFEPEADVTTAITTIITAIFTGGIAYMVPPGANETVSMVNGAARTSVVTPQV
jgi:uncharacterized protein YacL